MNVGRRFGWKDWAERINKRILWGVPNSTEALKKDLLPSGYHLKGPGYGADMGIVISAWAVSREI